MKGNVYIAATLLALLCGAGLVFPGGAQTASEKHAFTPDAIPYGPVPAFAVLRAVHADAGEEKCFPMVVRLDGAHLLENVLEAGHLIAESHHGIQLLTNRLPFVLDFRGPGKSAGIVDVGIAQGRDPGHGPFHAVLNGDAAAVHERAVGIEGVAAMAEVFSLWMSIGCFSNNVHFSLVCEANVHRVMKKIK